jgi:hypothetical protein
MPPKKGDDLPDHNEVDCHGKEDEQEAHDMAVPRPAHSVFSLTPHTPFTGGLFILYYSMSGYTTRCLDISPPFILTNDQLPIPILPAKAHVVTTPQRA